MEKYFSEQILESIKVKQAFFADKKLIKMVEVVSNVCIEALSSKKKIMVAGNGGSAADAQHFAAELLGKFYINRPSLAAIALTTDTSTITATGNDFSFDLVFSRQLEGLGQEGDVFIGISTSGNSKNIVEALNKARLRKIITVGLTGSAVGLMDPLCDYVIKVPSFETPRIQETHLLIEHLICSAIEKTLYG